MPTAARQRIALLLSGLAVLSGCGGESEEDRVSGVVESFVTAGNERDFDTVCGLLTEDARAQIDKVGKTLGLSGEDACTRTLLARAGDEAGNASVEVDEVRISNDSAQADVTVDDPDSEKPTQQTIELARDTEGDWRVASFGG
jgi:ketosteroid isomerase-like protein